MILNLLNVTGIFLRTTKFLKIYWIQILRDVFEIWCTLFKKAVKGYFVKAFSEIFIVISTSC